MATLKGAKVCILTGKQGITKVCGLCVKVGCGYGPKHLEAVQIKLTHILVSLNLDTYTCKPLFVWHL